MTGVRAKKRLGQNFLISKEVIKKIVDAIAPMVDDTIVEIGPGKGALTKPLAESNAKLTVVEFDRDLCSLLQKELAGFENLTIIQQDFLKFEPIKYELKKFKLCGNLPFNISSPVIDWTVENRSHIRKAVLMLQKEVALRLSSKPGSKQWSPLAIFTQLYFDINYLFDVSPQHFKPKPEVTSAVIQLTPKREVKVKHFEYFEKVVRASFKQRRKQLINNLVPEIIPAPETAVKVFKELGFEKNVRAEETTTEKFLELTEVLNKHSLI